MLLTGVAVEFILAIGKSEPVSLQRFGTLLAVILVLSVALELAERKKITWRRLVAGGLIAIGLLAVAAGVLVLLNLDVTGNASVSNVVGTIMISCGVIICMSGFYVAMQRGVVQRDDPAEYQNRVGLSQPLPGPNSALLTTFDGDAPASIVALCRKNMALYDLHFVGYYVNGKCRFYTDILDDNSEQMQNMRGDVPADTRRRRYEAYGRLTHGFVSRLDSTFEEVEQGVLIRVVLDVAQGAFYYTRVDARRFIFGVTMNQNAVLVADDKVRDIAVEIEKLSGLMPDGGLKPDPVPQAGPSNVLPMNARTAAQTA
ncbi:hypothetical protein ACFQX7_19300 [Luedemannella flava]